MFFDTLGRILQRSAEVLQTEIRPVVDDRWTSLEDRKLQLDARIKTGVRSGQLTPAEANILRDDFDLGGAGRRLGEMKLRPDPLAHHGEADEDDCRNDGPDDFETIVAVRVEGPFLFIAGAGPVTPDHVAETDLRGANFLQVKLCGADDCRWAFVDTTKNGSRNWCSMRSCGNRAKVQAYRARHR